MKVANTTMSTDTHTYANGTDKANYSENTELMMRNEIEGTIFHTLSRDEGKTWCGTMGKYIVTEQMDSEEKVKDYIKADGWKLRIDVMAIIVNELNRK